MKEVLKWIFGVFFISAAIGAIIENNLLASLLLAVAGLFCMPPTMTWLEGMFFSGKLRSEYKYIVVLGSLIVAGMNFTSSDKDLTNTTTTEIAKDTTADSINKARQEARLRTVNSFDSVARANALRIKKDEFKPDYVFYFPNNAPKYSNVSWMFPYLVKSGNDFTLRFVIQYEADDWLFIEDVKIKITHEDGTETVMDLLSGNFERDHSGGRIWEWLDTPVSADLYDKLVNISQAKSAKLRYNGQQYYQERNLSANEFKALRNMLNVYELVK
jgi:hypothetical protein